jgi:diguanylate cyclase (GGDEF)-like protein
MKPILQFDIGTLLAAEMLIGLTFALVLFILANRFPQLRGPSQIAWAFLSGAGGIFILLLRGHMPLLLNVLWCNGLLMGTNLLFYAGFCSLLGIRPRFRFPVATAVITLLCLVYFTAWENRIDIRIILLSTNAVLMRVNPVIDLMRYRNRSLIVRWLMFSIILWMASDTLRVVATIIHSSPQNFFQYNFIQSAYVTIGIFASCGLGIFSMALFAREITESLERRARRDPLTGAFNRLGIEELLTIELERSHRTRVTLSLALLDIDHFKAFNDSGGHAAGDEVLRNVVACISRHLRPFDACGRIGGDEFLVLLPGSSAPNIAAICDRILREVAALLPHTASGITPTVSIGFTEADAFDTVTGILARADRALYSAKNQGRNCAQMELAPIHALTDELPAATKPERRSSLRRAASSMRGFRL